MTVPSLIVIIFLSISPCLLALYTAPPPRRPKKNRQANERSSRDRRYLPWCHRWRSVRYRQRIHALISNHTWFLLSISQFHNHAQQLKDKVLAGHWPLLFGRQNARLLHWPKCSCVSTKTKLWKFLLRSAVFMPSLLSSGSPEYFTFTYCAWLWNWIIYNSTMHCMHLYPVFARWI